MNSSAGEFAGPGRVPFGGVAVGTVFGPVSYAVSAEANDRYWRAAGIDHPARHDGVLYPPMAANLTILAFQTVAPDPLLHTDQTLVAHRAAHAPARLVVTGAVTRRFAKRGREYVEVTAHVATDDAYLWTSVATFVEAGE
jgi:acyl-coenzyme A synthetase/AMP-(fatty) acid ligase